MTMYSPFRHIGSVFFKRNPLHLTFFVTRKCNMRCPFCFYLSNKDRETENVSKSTELSIDEIAKVSSSLKKLLWLAFSGGEIFLRPDIVEITEIFYKKNKPAIILFPTNGLLTGVIKEKIEAILNCCKKSTVVVKLSLDGNEKLHNSLRGQPGSFRKTMGTYRALQGFVGKYPNFELGINTVFCGANQDAMEKIIKLVNAMKDIKTHTVSLIRGDVSDKMLKEIDIKKYLETAEKLETNVKNKKAAVYRFKGAKIKAAQDILQRRLIHKTLIEGKRLIPCYAGRLNIVLTETGDVYPCEIITESFGNIRDYGYDMSKVIQSGKARKVTDSIMNKQCYCTHECYLMTNILFNPLLYPALFKEYVQLLFSSGSPAGGRCPSSPIARRGS